MGKVVSPLLGIAVGSYFVSCFIFQKHRLHHEAQFMTDSGRPGCLWEQTVHLCPSLTRKAFLRVILVT